MKLLMLDTETRSRTDISEGTDKYTRDAECLIVTYAFEDGPAKIWEPWQDPLAPQDLHDAVQEPSVIFVAHHAAFDRSILRRCLGIDVPVERWECTAAQARAHGLPGSLEMVAVVCGLPVDQQKIDGYALIDTFCIPQKATDRFIEPHEQPEAWTRFCTYALRDTEVLREIYKRLPAHNYVGENLAMWHLDQLINERGFGFDRRLAEAAVTFLSEAKATSDRVVQDNTGNAILSVRQNARLLTYVRDRFGIDIESLRAAEVIDWLERDDLNPIARTLLELRLEAGKSSGSKYKRGLQVVGPGDRIRHGLTFCGAGRTGRWSGKGLQVHNLPRPVLRVQRSGL
jgi:DNA polymerase